MTSGLLGTLVLVVSATVMTAASGPGSANKALYPAWFIRTPSIPGVRMAVGYAPVYRDTTISVREARAHGNAALQVSTGVRVRAEYLQEILVNGKVAYRGELFAEDTLAVLDTTAIIAESAFLPRMVLLMMSTQPLALPPGRAAFPSKAPKWTEETPTSGSGAYAVGMASAHFNEYDGWKEAERQARRTMAFALVTRLQSALESRTGGTTNGALIASTVTELRDVEVRERWRDDRRMYVLIHARPVTVR